MKMVELGTVVDNFDGKRIPLKSSDRDNLSKIYPYFGASGIIDHVDKYLFDGEYLLISEDGANLLSRTTPIAFVVNGKFWVNNHAHIVQGKEGVIINKYLEYYLNSKDISTYVTGSAQPKLNQEKLNSIPIPLPPLSTQKKIAAILDAADAYRQKTKALIEQYDRLAQSLFLEMFGDPVRNEKGWEKKILSEVCVKITDGTHQSPKFLNSGIPFLFISNIVDYQINFNTKKYISEEEYSKLTKSTPIEKDDILYTSVGSYGNPAIVKDDRKFCFQRHIALLKPQRAIINSVFLHVMLITPFVKRQIDSLAIGIAQKTLNLSAIKSIEIILPPITLQKEFASRITLIDQQKQQAQQSLEKAEALFNSLLQRAFKGELVS
jgi:type I restriction enzyme S subunit